MKICLSGLTASGKTTIAERLSAELNIANISKENAKTYRHFIDDSKIKGEARVIETANKKYAGAFDREIARLSSKGDCVISTWLSPWIIKGNALRVWLKANEKDRVLRSAKRRNMSIKQAKKYVELKDRETISSFKRIYKINVMEHDIFDIEINTSNMNVSDVVSIIAMMAVLKDSKRFR